MNQNPPLIKYPYLSHTRWRRTFTCSDVSDFQSMVMCRGTSLCHGKSDCGKI